MDRDRNCEALKTELSSLELLIQEIEGPITLEYRLEQPLGQEEKSELQTMLELNTMLYREIILMRLELKKQNVLIQLSSQAHGCSSVEFKS